MADSIDVLNGLIVVYTIYAVVMILAVGWFASRLTSPTGTGVVRTAYFYAFVGLLVFIGVSLHIVTYNTIPWASLDLGRSGITPDKTFSINVASHRFELPQEELLVRTGEKVLLNVTSSDLTYGFGLFRDDNTMVFQMQVIPGHVNDLLWQFGKPGTYTIRSTEYSGPDGARMMVRDAVRVVD